MTDLVRASAAAAELPMWPLRLPAGAGLLAWETGLEEAVHNLNRLLLDQALCKTDEAARAATSATSALRRLPILIAAAAAVVGSSHWTVATLLDTQLEHWIDLAREHAPRHPAPAIAPASATAVSELHANPNQRQTITHDMRVRVRVRLYTELSALHHARARVQIHPVASTPRACSVEPDWWAGKVARASDRLTRAMWHRGGWRWVGGAVEILRAVWRRTRLLWKLRLAQGAQEYWETPREALEVIDAWQLRQEVGPRTTCIGRTHVRMHVHTHTCICWTYKHACVRTDTLDIQA